MPRYLMEDAERPANANRMVMQQAEKASGSGVRMMGGQGIAPYGQRHSGDGVKGLGFFGAVPNPSSGGYSTELSAEFEHNGKTVEHPLMVPTLTAQEMALLLGGQSPTPEIYSKAQAFALRRISQGLSPFAGPTELRRPLPR